MNMFFLMLILKLNMLRNRLCNKFAPPCQKTKDFFFAKKTHITTRYLTCASIFFGRNSCSVELGIGKLKRTQPAAVKMLSHQSASTSLYTTTASRLSIRQGLQKESKIFNNELSFASVSLKTNLFSNTGVGNVCIFIYHNIGFVHPRPDEQTKCQTYFFPCKQFIIIVKNFISHQKKLPYVIKLTMRYNKSALL